MKRLVFCFDGTWNRLSVDTPTNVVLTAASIVRQREGRPTQIIHYDEGVGTGAFQRHIGGMFGWGLMTNVREAYRFLIFNYDPGDEIFIFGFSRGAWSARSFAGLIRHVGPISRVHAARIDEAVKLYTDRNGGLTSVSDGAREFRARFAGGVCTHADDDQWRCQNIPDYAAGQAPQMTIKYVGVWDTVGALGFPAFLPGSRWLNRKLRFHDTNLSSFVEAGRHAVAIDERRALFPVTQWSNLTELNAARGFEPDDLQAPYQERWFPGDHGSVGGGGDIRGLSDGALAWILDGAKRQGLSLDTERGTRIHNLLPDANAPLVNVSKPEFSPTQLINWDRAGPDRMWQISRAALRRWHASSKGGPYRPGSLRKVAAELDRYPADQFLPVFDGVLTEHTVQPQETLSKIAVDYYGPGQSDLASLIFEANRDQLDNMLDLFAGQKLRIPIAAVTGLQHPQEPIAGSG